jgi:hypothetical protein
LSAEPPGSSTGKKPDRAASLKAGLRHPLAITALSALAATLLLPAFTNQWQDRQRERDLKTDLATSLDELTTRTVIAARFVIDRRFREAQTTEARKAELTAAPPRQRLRARRAYRLALEKERDAAAASYIQLLADWLVTRSVIRSKLSAYYPSEDIAAEWERYADHITLYIRLASSASTPQDKGAYIFVLEKFLQESPGTWRVLVGEPRQLSRDKYLAYVKADALLGEGLLTEKNNLARRVLDSHVAGFSTGMRDLLKDLTPVYG